MRTFAFQFNFFLCITFPNRAFKTNDFSAHDAQLDDLTLIVKIMEIRRFISLVHGSFIKTPRYTSLYRTMVIGKKVVKTSINFNYSNGGTLTPDFEGLKRSLAFPYTCLGRLRTGDAPQGVRINARLQWVILLPRF